MSNTKRAVRDVHEPPVYVFKLYVADGEQNSQLARENLGRICREQLGGKCRIQEVDVLSDFTSALADGIFVTPTLILVSPEPRATIIGNLVDRERVVSALRLGSRL